MLIWRECAETRQEKGSRTIDTVREVFKMQMKALCCSGRHACGGRMPEESNLRIQREVASEWGVVRVGTQPATGQLSNDGSSFIVIS